MPLRKENRVDVVGGKSTGIEGLRGELIYLPCGKEVPCKQSVGWVLRFETRFWQSVIFKRYYLYVLYIAYKVCLLNKLT